MTRIQKLRIANDVLWGFVLLWSFSILFVYLMKQITGIEIKTWAEAKDHWFYMVYCFSAGFVIGNIIGKMIRKHVFSRLIDKITDKITGQ